MYREYIFLLLLLLLLSRTKRTYTYTHTHTQTYTLTIPSGARVGIEHSTLYALRALRVRAGSDPINRYADCLLPALEERTKSNSARGRCTALSCNGPA
uniref:Putative secreted protein n=1 Tax=Anopheles darlingi TaxID=43151 RepID=A0A2M4D0A0_ANODA